MQEPMPDLVAIKARQQQTWATGDFAVVGSLITIVSEHLCEAVDLRAGWEVLDVATGSGNTALAAARRFCVVTGVDYVPALLERGRERAAAERLPVAFLEGDAEALPFPDAAFDAVLSTFGAMFAPDQERAAAELLRVCRPGGRSGWRTGPQTATPARTFGPSAGTSRRHPGCGHPRAGGPRRGCASCSATRSARSGCSGAPSSSDSARPSTGSRSSAPILGRWRGPSRRSGPRARRRSRATCWR